MMVNSRRHRKVGLGRSDFSNHVYIIGRSGSGKTTNVRNTFKSLELAHLKKILPNSAIYIDIKDEDAKLFLRQCDRQSFANNNVTYLDLNRTNFAINLLGLPKYEPENHDAVVSRMVGHIIEMFKEFYSQQQTFVQLERILRLLLFYLYSNTDNPTLLDLYDLILRLQSYGQTELQRILQIYEKVSGPEMQDALRSLTKLTKDAWVPLLNRIESFATDNYMKNRFCVKDTTIDFDKMLVPGNITIFRIADTETPYYAHGLAIMAIVIKIWFAVQERAARIPQSKRSLAVLALDEFQKIKDLNIITSILSQARSYNLGLILSHQNLAQIPSELLQTIVGNTGTQIYGHVSGIDAAKIAKIIDPQFANDLVDQLASQPDFVFTMKMRASPGQEQPVPLQFVAHPPPPLLLNEYESEKFMQSMKEKYGLKEQNLVSSFIAKEEHSTKWLKQLEVEFPTKEKWQILLYLKDNAANLSEIVEETKSTDRDKTASLVSDMYRGRLISIARSRLHGKIKENYYTVSNSARANYFPDDFSEIGTASDIHEVATNAFSHYLEKKLFVAIARQEIKSSVLRTDLVAYDYETQRPISVEIESESEVSSHPEQVRQNMAKWQDLGFSKCHVWSRAYQIKRIHESLEPTLIDKVEVFLV